MSCAARLSTVKVADFGMTCEMPETSLLELDSNFGPLKVRSHPAS